MAADFANVALTESLSIRQRVEQERPRGNRLAPVVGREAKQNDRTVAYVRLDYCGLPDDEDMHSESDFDWFACDDYVSYRSQTAPNSGKLIQVVTPTGGEITYAYASTSATATVKGRPARPFSVVSHTIVSPGRVGHLPLGPSARQDYIYRDAVYNRDSAGIYEFRGFEEVIIMHPLLIR